MNVQPKFDIRRSKHLADMQWGTLSKVRLGWVIGTVLCVHLANIVTHIASGQGRLMTFIMSGTLDYIKWVMDFAKRLHMLVFLTILSITITQICIK